MARVLYISYTGLMDPLGESQVLQYLLGLAGRHDITLLTFERPANLAEHDRLVGLENRCRAAGIVWHRRVWHNRPGLPATLYDIVSGIRLGSRLSRQNRIGVLHCRSYIGSLIGLAVKRRTGAKLVFDMRGFWPDERVDGGIWRRDSWRYRVFKRIERQLFLHADHVVSLTRAGVREFRGFDYLAGRALPVSVVPTCTNLDLFQPTPVPRRGFTLGYVGSTGSWYMFDMVARAVARLFELVPDARFLVVNKGAHPQIRADLIAAGVDMSRVDLRSSPFDMVPGQIAQMDAGIFFIKPVWSKRASCPTRMGEFLACGKPCLANDKVGDVAEDFAQTGTGIALSSLPDGQLDMRNLDRDILRLVSLASEPGIADRCRAAAEQRFSLAAGTSTYDRIYDSLAPPAVPK